MYDGGSGEETREFVLRIEVGTLAISFQNFRWVRVIHVPF